LDVSAPVTHRNVGCSFHLTQLKRSSLHLEKCLVSQKILEHEISLQALKERMLDIEKNISNTTLAVGNLHCYMDWVGVPVHDLLENVATSIMFSEVTLAPFHVASRLTRLTGRYQAETCRITYFSKRSLRRRTELLMSPNVAYL
jgi:hypothetical protein